MGSGSDLDFYFDGFLLHDIAIDVNSCWVTNFKRIVKTLLCTVMHIV